MRVPKACLGLVVIDSRAVFLSWREVLQSRGADLLLGKSFTGIVRGLGSGGEKI